MTTVPFRLIHFLCQTSKRGYSRGQKGLSCYTGSFMSQLTQLAQMKCTACRGGEPSVSDGDLQEALPQLPGWQVLKDGIPKLEKRYRFKNFIEAMEFTRAVGSIAEEEGHHPALLTEWGKVTVSWWTHKIKGLHRNDLIMAAKTDDLYKGKF